MESRRRIVPWKQTVRATSVLLLGALSLPHADAQIAAYGRPDIVAKFSQGPCSFRSMEFLQSPTSPTG